MRKMHLAISALTGAGMVLIGLATGMADDDTKQLRFGDARSFGDAAKNPADQFLLSTPDGSVLISWTETGKAKRSRDAFLSALNDNGAPIGIAHRINDQEGRVHFYGGDNRAKFTVTGDGGITAIWAATLPEFRTGELRVAHAKKDNGFAPSTRLNDDEIPVNHAFATIATSPNGKVYAVWIDGRNREFVRMGEPVSPAEMRKDIKMRDLTIPDSILRQPPRPRKIYKHENAQLFMAVSEDGGKTFGPNYPISGLRVCPCCVPNIVFLDGGKSIIVSYRYVREDYMRDHVVIRSDDAGKTFSEPTYISDDGWVANFCPHAGTSLVSDRRGQLHTVWFTVGRQDEDAGIYYAFSDDGGKTFTPRQLIAKSPMHTVLHTQVILDSEDRVWAAWENIIESKPQIYLAHRARNETNWSPAYQVSDGSAVAMLPTLAARDGKVYVAWQDMKGERSQIKIRTAELETG
jgi:hypothetical protein